VAFATTNEWVLRLGAAKRAGRLDQELERLRRIPLVCGRGRVHPVRPRGGDAVLAQVSSRYERASMIVNSNKTFSAWAEIFLGELLGGKSSTGGNRQGFDRR
jgi:hypothetical protein